MQTPTADLDVQVAENHTIRVEAGIQRGPSKTGAKREELYSLTSPDVSGPCMRKFVRFLNLRLCCLA